MDGTVLTEQQDQQVQRVQQVKTDHVDGGVTTVQEEEQCDTVQEQECQRLMAALSEARGHRGKAAETLGMSRSTLWRKLGRYGLS